MFGEGGHDFAYGPQATEQPSPPILSNPPLYLRTPSALSVALAPPAKILVTTRGIMLLLLLVDDDAMLLLLGSDVEAGAS